MKVTNDGATILKSIGIDNPAAKILVGRLCGSGRCGGVVIVGSGHCGGWLLQGSGCCGGWSL